MNQSTESQGSVEKGDRASPAPPDQQNPTQNQSSNAPAEDPAMRRLPTHAKEKVSGSPRVTLRLHQVKEKKEKSKGQDSNFDNGAEVGMKEETGVVEGEEEGKEGEEKETVAGNGDRSGTQPAQADQPSQQGTKRSAPNSGTTGNGNSNTEQVQPAKQPQQLSGTKRSSGDTQESDDSDSRRKRRKDNNEPSDPTSSVESPGPKVPPLKIVLGGGSGSGGGSGGEEQARKSGGSRLPYVVQPPPEEPPPPVAQVPASVSPPLEPAAQPAQQNQDVAAASQDSPSVPQSQPGQQDGQDSHKRVLRSHRSGNGSSGHSSPAGVDVGSPRSQVSPLPAEGPAPCEPPGEEQPKEDQPQQTAPVELHPRKRKLKQPRDAENSVAQPPESAGSPSSGTNTTVAPVPASDPPPPANCYQLFLNIRKQIDRRRKGLFPVQPKPPQGFKDYLMNRCTYVLAGNANNRIPPPNQTPPPSVPAEMKDMFLQQEKERYRLRTQHVIEKEKLVLSVEQEILRVHGRAARALANQALPFSACTILRDEEVYSPFSAEQEEKERNARSRYNGRLFISWLQDVDDKWEKIKEAMLLRHHNEAESLHAVQKMDWNWKLKEVTAASDQPQIDDSHVPMVHVSDDFDLLPT